MRNLTAEARRRGEASGTNLTTETRRHGDSLFQSAWNITRAVLREIFDESSYERFLSRTQDSRSVASYRAFVRERDAAIMKKPRCC